MAQNSGSNGISGFGLLVVGTFLLFLGLKLGEVGVVSTWGWEWITAPLWIPFAFGISVGLFVIAIVVVVYTILLLIGFLFGIISLIFKGK